MEQQLITKIEESFPAIRGQVRKIFFQADNRHFQQKKQTQNIKKEKKEEFRQKWHKHSPQYKMLAQKAEYLLTDVTDPELKESLKSLFIQLSDK